jgi:hypothetical protein
MSEEIISRPVQKLAGWARRARPLVFTFLLIEFYDEASYAIAVVALVMMVVLWAQPFPERTPTSGPISWRSLIREIRAGLAEAARNRSLWRWILLLQTSNLMMDIFVSYLLLYLTDAGHLTPAQASLALSGYMLGSLIADLALIPLLERFSGRIIVRASAICVAGLYIAFLLAPGSIQKVGLLMLLAVCHLGWYAVLSGERYAAVPGRSGTVKALDALGNLFEGGALWLVGSVASAAGLSIAMWLLLFGPLSLILFVPGKNQ